MVVAIGWVRYFIPLVLMIFLVDVRAQVVNSCTGVYLVNIVACNEMIVLRDG